MRSVDITCKQQPFSWLPVRLLEVIIQVERTVTTGGASKQNTLIYNYTQTDYYINAIMVTVCHTETIATAPVVITNYVTVSSYQYHGPSREDDGTRGGRAGSVGREKVCHQ